MIRHMFGEPARYGMRRRQHGRLDDQVIGKFGNRLRYAEPLNIAGNAQ